jgi:hypothetical protein
MKNHPSHEIGGENKFGAIWTTFLKFFGRQKSLKKVSKMFIPRFLKILPADFAEILSIYGEGYCHTFHQISCFYCEFCLFEPRAKKASLPKLYMSPFAEMSHSVDFLR